MILTVSSRTACGALFCATAALGQACHAQAIEFSHDRFAPPPTLPFAAPPPAPSPPPPPPPPLPPKPSFALLRDQPIHTELQAWAKGQDWELLWYPAFSWRVLRDADLSHAADVTAAVTEAIDILRGEGKPLRLKISDGNRVMEVFSTEVSND